MDKFTARVELHDAQERHYDILHAEMGKKGFSRTITSDDGKKFKLPWAEYNLEANWTRDRVLQEAKAAATTTGKEYEILVTEAIARIWFNLTPA